MLSHPAVSLIRVSQPMLRVQDVNAVRIFHHMIVGGPLSCVGVFQLVTLRAHHATFYVDDCFCPGTSQHSASFPRLLLHCRHDRLVLPLPLLYRRRSACQSSSATPTASYSQLRNLVDGNCVWHTVAGAHHAVCRYHQKRTKPETMWCSHMSSMMRMITVHCITTGTSTILSGMKYRVTLTRHGLVHGGIGPPRLGT